MSKTYRFDPKSSDPRHVQVARINRLRGAKRINAREKDRMRERAFDAIYARSR